MENSEKVRFLTCRRRRYNEKETVALTNMNNIWLRNDHIKQDLKLMKVVNITEVVIKLQFKLTQALISRGFT